MNQRWWIRPPMPDESLSSVLSRAAALYECSPSQIWESLNRDDPKPAGDVDLPSYPALRRMAAAIGVPPSGLLAHRLRDAPWLLASQARTAYCQACWSEDHARGNPYSIRRGWTRALRTFCPNHGYPLRLAPEHWAISSLSSPFQLPTFTEVERQILSLIESFGQALEGSLYSGQPWPNSWRANPQATRQLLLAFSFNVNEVRDFPSTKFVQAPANLAEFIRGPLHLEDPVKKLRWDLFRGLADPAIRRAGLWATAWTVMPNCPAALSPGWLKLPAHIEARIHSK